MDMPMMNMEVWSGKDLQNINTALLGLSNSGAVSIKDALRVVRNEINRRGIEQAKLVEAVPDLQVCPECGKSPLLPVFGDDGQPTVDGLKIIECRKCLYSEVVK